MASWKKMAEAFGRAIQNPGSSKGGRNMVFNSKTVKTRPDGTDPRALATEEQIAFDRGALEAGEDLGNILEKHEVPEEARRIWDNYDRDFAQAYGQHEAYKRALERAKAPDETRRIWYNSGDDLPASAEEFEARYGFPIDNEIPDNSDVIRRQFDKAMTNRTDESLAKNEVDRINSELWNRAFMSADKDLQSNQLWHIISDLRNKGITEADILNLLRSMGK